MNSAGLVQTLSQGKLIFHQVPGRADRPIIGRLPPFDSLIFMSPGESHKFMSQNERLKTGCTDRESRDTSILPSPRAPRPRGRERMRVPSLGFMDIRGIWRKWKEQKRTNQKNRKLKEKKGNRKPAQKTGNRKSTKKQEIPPKKRGHRKSPKTDESRTENAPIEKQKTQRKIGNPPKKRGHRKSPKTNEPRPEKRLAPPKIA